MLFHGLSARFFTVKCMSQRLSVYTLNSSTKPLGNTVFGWWVLFLFSTRQEEEVSKSQRDLCYQYHLAEKCSCPFPILISKTTLREHINLCHLATQPPTNVHPVFLMEVAPLLPQHAATTSPTSWRLSSASPHAMGDPHPWKTAQQTENAAFSREQHIYSFKRNFPTSPDDAQVIFSSNSAQLMHLSHNSTG